MTPQSLAAKPLHKSDNAQLQVFRKVSAFAPNWKPVPHQPYRNNPQYILVYVTETLECGHALTVYPQADPLIAKRRVCPECSVPKKPVASVALAKKAGAA